MITEIEYKDAILMWKHDDGAWYDADVDVMIHIYEDYLKAKGEQQDGRTDYEKYIDSKYDTWGKKADRPQWNCTANFVAEQLNKLREMTDEEKWEFFKRFFSLPTDGADMMGGE